MHHAVLQWVDHAFKQWDSSTKDGLNILEFGSLDINGSVRSVLQQHSQLFVGVDMQSGPGVDVVGDAETFNSDQRFDIVVCCEVFEHTPRWREIIQNSHRLMVDGGLFIATMAGEGRPPHSAIDENPIRDWEYYGNVGSWELTRTMRLFSKQQVDVLGTDIRTFGIK